MSDRGDAQDTVQAVAFGGSVVTFLFVATTFLEGLNPVALLFVNALALIVSGGIAVFAGGVYDLKYGESTGS